jgi:hypothetical protein
MQRPDARRKPLDHRLIDPVSNPWNTLRHEHHRILIMNSLHVIGAVLLLSLTAFNTQRHQMDLHRQQMRAEVEMQATIAGTRLLDQLATLPFDVNVGSDDVSLFALESSFGGAQTLADASVLHDVHGMSTVLSGSSGLAPMAFRADASVAYVQPSDDGFVAALTPTRFMEVTLDIQGELNSSLSLKRVYSAGR